MNKDLHNIDDLFKNSIESHLEEVPPDVWNNIDHSLDKKQAAFYKRRYFAVRAAAILLILVGGVTIAAILHFNQREKVSVNAEGQNTVTTSNSKGNNNSKEITVQKEPSKNLTVEKKNEEQNTVLHNNKGDKQGNEISSTTVNHKKGNSKKYGAINDDNYTAQENEEVAVGTNKNKSAKQDGTVKYKTITKSSVDLVVSKQQINLQEKIVGQQNSPVVQAETIKDVQRTTHVDAGLLSINKVDLATSLTANGLNGSPIFLPTISSTSKPIRLRNHYNAWSISPMYAQNVNLNTLKDDDHFRDPRNNSREAKRTEQETKSFSIGLSVQRQISRNISLQSGIQYFSSETNIQPKTIFAEQGPGGDVRFRFSCSSGESYLPTKTGAPPTSGDSIKTNFSKSEIFYLQVPLLVSYQINLGKFSFMPSAGIQTNFLLNGKLNSYLEHPTGAEEEVYSSIDGLRSSYLSGVIQPQLNYKLSDRISFDFNPNINFSLSPINKETAVKTYQNILSVGAGIRIKL